MIFQQFATAFALVLPAVLGFVGIVWVAAHLPPRFQDTPFQENAAAVGFTVVTMGCFFVAYHLPFLPVWVWLITVVVCVLAVSLPFPPERIRSWFEVPCEPSPLPPPPVPGWEYSSIDGDEGKYEISAHNGMRRVSQVLPEAGLREQGEELPQWQQLVTELQRPWPELPGHIREYDICVETSLSEDQLILKLGYGKVGILEDRIANPGGPDDLRRELQAFVERAEKEIAAIEEEVAASREAKG